MDVPKPVFLGRLRYDFLANIEKAGKRNLRIYDFAKCANMLSINHVIRRKLRNVRNNFTPRLKR